MVASGLDDLPQIGGGLLVELGGPLKSQSIHPTLDIRRPAPHGGCRNLRARLHCYLLDLVRTTCPVLVHFGSPLQVFRAIVFMHLCEVGEKD